nr:MAG: dihydroorotase [Hyphomicrobiales bacterium]
MNRKFDLLIRNGICVSSGGSRQANIGIRSGKIAEMGAPFDASADQTFDAKGLHILPGIIDTHVHFREPGFEHKENMETGSRSAVMGGVTSVFEMPNNIPPTTTRAALDDKMGRAETSMHCDYAFYIGATHDNIDDLAELECLPGVAGVKLFMGSSTGNLLLAQDDEIFAALRSGKRRISVHAEDEMRLRERFHLAMPGDPATHAIWRDKETARLATERLLRLARAAQRRVHLLHVTTSEEIPLLAAARDIATVETTVQHLTLSAPECYEKLGTRAQMNPPLRKPCHRKALWQAVGEGIVDVVGSDHAPHSLAEKGGLYPQTPSGLPGVQTLLTLMLDHVHAGQLSLERLVELTSEGPARVFGIANKGSLALGKDADLAIVDLKAKRTITNDWIESRCGWTPYDGVVTSGWPIATILRGAIVVREGKITAAPSGRPLHFTQS